jgi:heme exporter protein D
MSFHFDSWQAFLHMGGYGFFVWLAFGVSLLAVLATVYEGIWAKQQLIKAVNAQMARRQRIKQAKQREAATDELAISTEIHSQEVK